MSSGKPCCRGSVWECNLLSPHVLPTRGAPEAGSWTGQHLMNELPKTEPQQGITKQICGAQGNSKQRALSCKHPDNAFSLYCILKCPESWFEIHLRYQNLKDKRKRLSGKLIVSIPKRSSLWHLEGLRWMSVIKNINKYPEIDNISHPQVTFNFENTATISLLNQ